MALRLDGLMPLHDYEGMTFVAFTDISGFREMMRDRKKAVQALAVC